MDTRTLEVRARLPAALIGLAIFTALGRWFDPDFFQSVTFGIGVGTLASATFVEPFFTRPQDALVNCLAGIVAFIAIEKTPEEPLDRMGDPGLPRTDRRIGGGSDSGRHEYREMGWPPCLGDLRACGCDRSNRIAT
jgi:hypothetical protein